MSSINNIGPINRTGSQDNERYQINKVLGDMLDTLQRADQWDQAVSWGDHNEAGYAPEDEALLASIQVPTSLNLSYTRTTLPNGTDVATIRATWLRVSNPEFVYDLEIRKRDIGDTALGTLYSVPIISNTEGGTIAAYESQFELGKNYQFRIRVRRNRTISPWSAYFDISAVKDSTAPGGGGSGSAFGFNLTGAARIASVELSWTRPNTPNLARFELQRTVGGSTTTISLDGNFNRFTDSGLDAGRQYTYRIRAISFEGVATALSNTVTVTPIDYVVPTVPTGLAATSRLILRERGAQVAEFTYSWDSLTSATDPDIIDLNAVTYEIEVSREGVVQDTEVVSSNTTPVKHSFVGEVGVQYSARVRARNVTQVSAWSGSVSITQPFDTTSPGNVTGLSATGFPGVVDLRWTNPDNRIISSIEIERRVSGVGSYVVIGEVPFPSNEYIDVTANVGTTYQYLVRAKSAASPPVFGNYSAVASATALEPGFLAPSTAPIITVTSEIRTLLTGTQVALYTVRWTRFVGDNFTYDLQVRDGASGPTVLDIVLSNPADGTQVSYQFTGETNKTYCFRARARNATVVSDWSNQVCTTLGNDASPPGNITNISALGIYQGALLNWNIPGFLGTNYSHVEIWRRVGSSGNGVKVADVSRPMEHYFDDGLVIGTSYQYRLRSVSFAGVLGNFTAWVSVTPLNVPVGSIQTASISDLAITAPLIAANAVIADKIAANAVTTDKLNAGAVTADKISVNNLQAVSTSTGTLTANLIRTAATGQRLEITDPGTDAIYAIWIGSSTKNDANGKFWVKHSGAAKIDGGTFGIGTRGKTNTASNTALAGQSANTLTVDSGDFTSNGNAVVVTGEAAYFGAKSTSGTCAAEYGAAPSDTSGNLRVQRSTDGGSNWTNVGNLVPFFAPVNTQTFGASPDPISCYASTNLDRTFTVIDETPPSGTLRYRIIYDSFSSFFLTAQTVTNRLGITALQG